MFYFSRQCEAHKYIQTHTHTQTLHLSVPTRVRVQERKISSWERERERSSPRCLQKIHKKYIQDQLKVVQVQDLR